MADKTNPVELEYLDKAFGLNLDQVFEDLDPEYMPLALQKFVARGRNKRIYIGGTEKQPAKAFRTSVEKRSGGKKPLPTPLILIHREIGTTTDQYDYYSKTEQFAALVLAFKAKILPKTFNYTIQILGRKEQRDLLEIMTMLIDGRFRENTVFDVPHVVRWSEEGVPKEKEIKNYVQLLETDTTNPAWTPAFEGGFMTLEKGQEVLTHIVLSSMITPSIIDFNFLGVESL